MFELMIMLAVVGTSIWVLIDATSIKAQKGLIKGVFDMGPGGWFISCLLLWVVAFPCYLSIRKDIIAAVHSWEHRRAQPIRIISSDPIEAWEQQQKTSARSITVRPVAPAEPTIDCPLCNAPILAAAIQPGSNICQKCGKEFVADVV